jgi:hypothetical protein
MSRKANYAIGRAHGFVRGLFNLDREFIHEPSFFRVQSKNFAR